MQADGEVRVDVTKQSNTGSGDQQVTDGECDVGFVHCNISLILLLVLYFKRFPVGGFIVGNVHSEDSFLTYNKTCN